MPSPPRILVVGATGVFGERLVRGLQDTTPFAVIAAARGLPRLQALQARYPGLAILQLDAAAATPDALRATGAMAAVDAAGPFQGASLRFPRIALAAGLHYLDLADARDFVAAFPALDAGARAAGRVALTGCSSTPALSNAALDALVAGWRRVDRVEVAISPGNRAPRGLSVVRAILAYAGRPVRVRLDSRWQVRPGWGMTVRRAMPGLGPRFLALVDTPDLDIIPARFPVRDAVFRAGLELPVLHLGLLLASLPVRARLLPSLSALGRPVRAAADLLYRFGTDRGGMTVDAHGLDAGGRPVHATWSLLAEGGHGPDIPTLPAIAALRAIADGRLRRPGAAACAGLLTLRDMEAEFAGRRITSTIRLRPAHPATPPG